ncbi:MAG: hypothetical protein ACJ8GN_15030 [Longimicrobiaceae bacterium]
MKSILAAALALASACSPAGDSSSAAVDRDEAAIYSLVTDSVLDTAGDPFVVMAESTVVTERYASRLAESAIGLDSTFPAAALRDFEARNRTPVVVPRTTLSGKRIRHLRLGSFDPDRDRDSVSVLRGYEPVRLLHMLSRPGFDPERRRAIVTTGTGCGDLCGETRVVLLARDARGWHVTGWKIVMQG